MSRRTTKWKYELRNVPPKDHEATLHRRMGNAQKAPSAEKIQRLARAISRGK